MADSALESTITAAHMGQIGLVRLPSRHLFAPIPVIGDVNLGMFQSSSEIFVFIE